MFSRKELRKSIRVVIPTAVTHHLDEWLSMKFTDVCGVFDITVPAHSRIIALGVETLSDLLLFTKKGLSSGKGFSIEEFESMPEKDKRRITQMQEKSIFILVNPPKPWNKKVGPVAMAEIENMLTQLKLKFK